jgi:disulfide bond formation protein DsbB
MSETARGPSDLLASLDRLAMLLMLFALAAILTAAMVMQYAFGEVPCPLCLLQRVAMFGVCFGVMRELREGTSAQSTGLGLIFAILLLVISVRQTLLDLVPRPGHDYVGSAIFGLHMPVWSVIIALALLAGFAGRLALFGGPHVAPERESMLMRRAVQALCGYVIAVCAINLVSVVVQCGVGQCHTTGYRLLSP